MSYIIRYSLKFNYNKIPLLIMSNKKSKSSKETLASTNAAQASNPSQENAIFINKNGNFCLNISAKPGAKETGVSDIKHESIDVKIAAPPVDGEANKELIRYIAKLLKLRTSDVNLDKGSKSRNKILILTNCQYSLEQLLDILKNESES